MLIDRDRYIQSAMNFRDTDLVKVVTGVRRSGKSSLLKLVRSKIECENVPGRGFVSLNLESRNNNIKNDVELYEYVRKHLSKTGKTYIFIDEIQRIVDWQDVINAMRVDFNCDIYVTGSNAFLLSSELATYLSGRYVEVKMLPLTFSEYCTFLDVHFAPDSMVTSNGAGDYILFDDLLLKYLIFGGMPALASQNTTQDMHRQYFDGFYEAVIQRDVLNRERQASERAISDPDLLRRICEYLADTVGNVISASNVANVCGVTHPTASSYIKALVDAYVFYPCKRYDIHGKALLRTNPKYYAVDLGLINYLSGYRSTHTGFAFENAVYLQLLYEGWNVHVGRLYNNEIDFICTKDSQTLYVQVTEEMMAEATRERELKPLLPIKDNYQKIIVVRQGNYPTDIDGILIKSAKDFFLETNL